MEIPELNKEYLKTLTKQERQKIYNKRNYMKHKKVVTDEVKAKKLEYQRKKYLEDPQYYISRSKDYYKRHREEAIEKVSKLQKQKYKDNREHYIKNASEYYYNVKRGIDTYDKTIHNLFKLYDIFKAA